MVRLRNSEWLGVMLKEELGINWKVIAWVRVIDCVGERMNKWATKISGENAGRKNKKGNNWRNWLNMVSKSIVDTWGEAITGWCWGTMAQTLFLNSLEDCVCLCATRKFYSAVFCVRPGGMQMSTPAERTTYSNGGYGELSLHEPRCFVAQNPTTVEEWSINYVYFLFDIVLIIPSIVCMLKTETVFSANLHFKRSSTVAKSRTTFLLLHTVCCIVK